MDIDEDLFRSAAKNFYENAKELYEEDVQILLKEKGCGKMQIVEPPVKLLRFVVDEWNFVADKGFPKDDEAMSCILVVKNVKGTYDYEFGGYNEQFHSFYNNFGLGGCVIEADSVVAWAPLFTGKNFLTVVE